MCSTEGQGSPINLLLQFSWGESLWVAGVMDLKDRPWVSLQFLCLPVHSTHYLSFQKVTSYHVTWVAPICHSKNIQKTVDHSYVLHATSPIIHGTGEHVAPLPITFLPPPLLSAPHIPQNPHSCLMELIWGSFLDDSVLSITAPCCGIILLYTAKICHMY